MGSSREMNKTNICDHGYWCTRNYIQKNMSEGHWNLPIPMSAKIRSDFVFRGYINVAFDLYLSDTFIEENLDRFSLREIKNILIVQPISERLFNKIVVIRGKYGDIDINTISAMMRYKKCSIEFLIKNIDILVFILRNAYYSAPQLNTELKSVLIDRLYEQHNLIDSISLIMLFKHQKFSDNELSLLFEDIPRVRRLMTNLSITS